MSTTKEMTIDERRKYLRLVKPRYMQAGRTEKGQLLTEMETVTGLDRKTLIRLLNGSLERRPRRRQRGKTYGPELEDALRVIDESFDGICPERLKPNLVWMAQHLAQHGELTITPALLQQLEQVSISTLGRRLEHVRQDQPRLPRKKPQPRNPLLQGIPMKRLPWDLQEPGHFETDLVHHSGPTAVGDYVCTLQMIDVFTSWSERRAVLGRSYRVMEDAFLVILHRLPFPVVEIHPDNGSEFFNHHMLRFWGNRVPGITLSRTRPYRKNDNPRAEQKNSTLVRAYLGYDRFDTVAQMRALNALYNQMWVYYNLFQPVMHLVDKQVTTQQGQPVRVKRLYDEAATPFDRLCQTDAILPEHRDQLAALRDAINPHRLHQDIYDTIEQLSRLPGATPGHTENVYLTLTSIGLKKDFALPFAFDRTPIEP